MFTKTFLAFSMLIKFSLASDVVTTLPEFNWVVKELAPKLESVSLLNGNEDPHFIDATPSFIFKIAKTKLIIRNGLQLEDAWLNKVLEQAGNTKVLNKGNCNASRGIDSIEKISNYDRSMGDVHAVGNPHYSLSPKRMITAVETIANCLKSNFKQLKDVNENLKKLKRKLSSLNQKFKKMKFTKKFYVYHTEFSYLKADYGVILLKSLERIPGVLPSASHLLKVTKSAKLDRPSMVVASNNASKKVLNKFKEMSSIDYKKVIIHPKQGEDYIKFIERIFEIFK